MSDTGHVDSESKHFSPYRTDGKLYGFVCVVTGSTQPIGRAIVTELAAHGAACIYACSTSPTSLTESDTLADTVNAQFPNTKVIGYPYANPSEQSTLTLIDDILNQWGRLDIWVCSTVLLGPSSITSTSPSDLSAMFEEHAMPAFFALKYAPAAMQKTTPKGEYINAAPKDVKYGSIIVVTSVAGTGPAFTMSSHAALGVVRAGVEVLKGTGVRINAIVAGQVDEGVGSEESSLLQSEELRKVIGLERAGRPEEVGRVAGFLASGFSSYMTGAELRVDGGAGALSPFTVPV